MINRDKEKQASRLADEQALASGEKTRQQLREENHIFAGRKFIIQFNKEPIMSNKSFLLKIVVGDWSHDGHGRTESILIKSNRSYAQLDAAYLKGSSIVGFNIVKFVGSEWDSCCISKEEFLKLRELGLPKSCLEVEPYLDHDYKEVRVCTDDYMRLYLFIVKLGDPEFRYKIVKVVDVNINGYCLLGN